MIDKTDKNPQLNVFRIPLVSVINMKYELVELAQRIDWKSIEQDFAVIGKQKCSENGNCNAVKTGTGIQ